MRKKLIPVFIVAGALMILAGIAYAISYVKVTVSSNSPAGGCLWATTSSYINFATFELKNSTLSDENIIVDSLTINNTGTSATSTNILTNFYLLDDQNHTIATSTAINNNTFIFNNLDFFIPPGWSRSFVLKGNMGQGTVPGQTIVISIPSAQAITAHEQTSLNPVNVTGSFPVNGNAFMLIPTP
jgi:hypothetical protein